jgi:hypothetical protein
MWASFVALQPFKQYSVSVQVWQSMSSDFHYICSGFSLINISDHEFYWHWQHFSHILMWKNPLVWDVEYMEVRSLVSVFQSIRKLGIQSMVNLETDMWWGSALFVNKWSCIFTFSVIVGKQKTWWVVQHFT